MCLDGFHSSWRKVWSGIPQGSVLGLVLFLIFINDTDSSLSSNVLKFAHDTKVFSVIDSYIHGYSLQADLGNIEKWADLSTNVKWYTMAKTIPDSSMICMGTSYRK